MGGSSKGRPSLIGMLMHFSMHGRVQLTSEEDERHWTCDIRTNKGMNLSGLLVAKGEGDTAALAIRRCNKDLEEKIRSGTA